MNVYKFRDFYVNKYVVSPLARKTYYLSYNYKYKTLWYRTYKVGSRTIRAHFKENTPGNQDIYSSEVGYLPGIMGSFYKFAFVREPVDKFLSAWKNKVLEKNYFKFSEKEHKRMKDLPKFIDWVESLDIDNCDEHLRSQNSLIDLNEVDFIGRFENFEEDFHKLCRTVGLPIKKIPVKNKSKLKGPQVSSASKRRIVKIYEKDYRIFYPGSIELVETTTLES